MGTKTSFCNHPQMEFSRLATLKNKACQGSSTTEFHDQAPWKLSKKYWTSDGECD